MSWVGEMPFTLSLCQCTECPPSPINKRAEQAIKGCGVWGIAVGDGMACLFQHNRRALGSGARSRSGIESTHLPVGGLSRWSSKTHSLQPGDASSTSKKSKYGYEMILRWQSALPRIVAQARGILISPWVCHVKEYKQGAESKVVPYILLSNGKVLIFGIRKQQKTPSSKQVITRS